MEKSTIKTYFLGGHVFMFFMSLILSLFTLLSAQTNSEICKEICDCFSKEGFFCTLPTVTLEASKYQNDIYNYKMHKKFLDDAITQFSNSIESTSDIELLKINAMKEESAKLSQAINDCQKEIYKIEKKAIEQHKPSLDSLLKKYSCPPCSESIINPQNITILQNSINSQNIANFPNVYMTSHK